MQTNQEASEDDVLLRIKAWCLQAFEPSVTDRRTHMFLSRVPSLIEAGNSQSLSERLEASEKKKTCPPEVHHVNHMAVAVVVEHVQHVGLLLFRSPNTLFLF